MFGNTPRQNLVSLDIEPRSTQYHSKGISIFMISQIMIAVIYIVLNYDLVGRIITSP